MYGLIGRKLGHSFSANFFNKKFKEENINETYRLLPLENIEELPEILVKYPDLKGLNVTIPYKEEVIRYLSEISEEARQIGAVNVIKIVRKNNLINLKGYNSDCYGFKESLVPLLRSDIKNALILGTGGASKAVAYVLNSLGINITFVSRHPKENQLSYENIDEGVLNRNLLVVNTTPLGMFPEVFDYPALPYQYLTKEHVCYDLVYNPLETEFMKHSEKYGAKVKNGLEMLKLQAIKAWEIWNK